MFVSLVIPLYNQVQYTQQCLKSVLSTCDIDNVEIILIDNASTDETSAYLDTLPPSVICIKNNDNKGFAGACNQGIRRATAPWIVVMNNDVVVTPGWLSNLLKVAVEYNLDCVSPGIREGVLNYDIISYGEEFTHCMRTVLRRGVVSGICFAATRSLYDSIGVFDENFLYGQYEDADLFKRAERAGFNLGTTGRSFIHHFGSITQKGMGVKNKVSPHVIHNKKYFIRKWSQSRIERLFIRNKAKLLTFIQSRIELFRYGHSLVEKLVDGTLKHY